ncbi:UNVERIFIED_CONTAM: hypothetical protein HDU68_007044 [Siphonaria sp. JEL0065]|nr:hypothetical protein HDU68_007044 [Siphonaria sp. JEL0065]
MIQIAFPMEPSLLHQSLEKEIKQLRESVIEQTDRLLNQLDRFATHDSPWTPPVNQSENTGIRWTSSDYTAPLEVNLQHRVPVFTNEGKMALKKSKSLNFDEQEHDYGLFSINTRKAADFEDPPAPKLEIFQSVTEVSGALCCPCSTKFRFRQ